MAGGDPALVATFLQSPLESDVPSTLPVALPQDAARDKDGYLWSAS